MKDIVMIICSIGLIASLVLGFIAAGNGHFNEATYYAVIALIILLSAFKISDLG